MSLVNAMVLVMIVALIVSLAIKSWIEGGVIAGEYMYSGVSLRVLNPPGVILLNVVVGFMQQYTAEQTM